MQNGHFTSSSKSLNTGQSKFSHLLHNYHYSFCLLSAYYLLCYCLLLNFHIVLVWFNVLTFISAGVDFICYERMLLCIPEQLKWFLYPFSELELLWWKYQKMRPTNLFMDFNYQMQFWCFLISWNGNNNNLYIFYYKVL